MLYPDLTTSVYPEEPGHPKKIHIYITFERDLTNISYMCLMFEGFEPVTSLAAGGRRLDIENDFRNICS